MPYALMSETAKDGGRPAYRLIRDPSEALPGEVVVAEEPGEGEVWDSASGVLRPRTGAEDLQRAKVQKIDAFADAAVDGLAPMFTPGKGRDETALLVAGHVLKICEALKIPPDPRLRTVVETGQWALAKKAEVEAATTVEALGSVSWT